MSEVGIEEELKRPSDAKLPPGGRGPDEEGASHDGGDDGFLRGGRESSERGSDASFSSGSARAGSSRDGSVSDDWEHVHKPDPTEEFEPVEKPDPTEEFEPVEKPDDSWGTGGILSLIHI